jgi:hypothetical protein
MNPCHTDAELIRAGQFTASPIVRVLVARIADRNNEALAVRDLLATIRGMIDAGQLREALALIDKAREALDWRWSVPHYPAAIDDPLKKD